MPLMLDNDNVKTSRKRFFFERHKDPCVSIWFVSQHTLKHFEVVDPGKPTTHFPKDHSMLRI